MVIMNENYKYVKNNNLLDIFKFVASLLIVGSHCLPIFHTEIFNYYYGQWFFRFCVPFFFITTGYFFETMNNNKKINFIKHVLKLYLICTIIYFPLIFKNMCIYSNDFFN